MKSKKVKDGEDEESNYMNKIVDVKDKKKGNVDLDVSNIDEDINDKDKEKFAEYLRKYKDQDPEEVLQIFMKENKEHKLGKMGYRQGFGAKLAGRARAKQIKGDIVEKKIPTC